MKIKVFNILRRLVWYLATKLHGVICRKIFYRLSYVSVT